MANVTFYGTTQLIVVNPGVTSIAMLDVYSAWKLWVSQSDNAKYNQALFALGGDPLPGGKFLGTTYFLENGWKIRPYEGNHVLTINGNLQTRDGSDPMVSTLGTYNVRVMLTVSNLVDAVNTGGGVGTVAEVRDAVWQANLDTYVAGTAGNWVKKKLLSAGKFLGLK